MCQISRDFDCRQNPKSITTKYERFEDLPVWQAAADLAAKMFDWTNQTWFRGKGDLSNQLQRSALSISNNIAEGFERGTTNELLQFLYIARGSAGEVRSMLAVMERMLRDEPSMRSQISDLKSQIAVFKTACEGISRQIHGWANSLQNSSISGHRHLNDNTKQGYEQRQQQDAFQKRLNALNDEARRKRNESQRESTEHDDESSEN